MKMSSEARIVASERIGGFESCHPSAPGDRPESRLHPETRFLVVAPPAGESRQVARRAETVPLVDEAAAHRARARVQVLVRAPDGEVHVPVVEAQDEVARRVRQVPADDATLRLREPRDRLDLERLARVVLDSRKQDQRDRLALAFQNAGDVRRIDRLDRGLACVRVGPQPHERFRRVEAVDDRLRLDRVVVGGKGVLLDQDPMPLARRPVEARHHQVQVDGERVHRHDLARRGAHEPRHRLREELVVGHPRVLPREMRLDGEPLPLLELLVDVPPSSPGEEPERIAGEVDLFLAVLASRECGIRRGSARAGRRDPGRPRSLVRSGTARSRDFRRSAPREDRATRAPCREAAARGSSPEIRTNRSALPGAARRAGRDSRCRGRSRSAPIRSTR